MRQAIKRTGKKGSRTSKRRKLRKASAQRCNDLWSRYIKRHGVCEFIGEQIGLEVHTTCKGSLQAMHGFGKKTYPAVRYAVWNGFCGCAAAHSYYTWREPEWQNVLRVRWGNEVYEQRLRDAILTRKHDFEEIAASLRMALGCEGF